MSIRKSLSASLWKILVLNKNISTNAVLSLLQVVHNWTNHLKSKADWTIRFKTWCSDGTMLWGGIKGTQVKTHHHRLVRWSFVVHRTVLELHSETEMKQLRLDLKQRNNSNKSKKNLKSVVSRRTKIPKWCKERCYWCHFKADNDWVYIFWVECSFKTDSTKYDGFILHWSVRDSFYESLLLILSHRWW